MPADSRASDDEIDLLQLFSTLWRKKLLIGVLAVAGATGGYFYATQVAKPVYQASAVVAVESRETQLTDLDALVGGLSAEQPSLNTEIELIRSRQLLERMVLQEGLLDDPEFNPALATVEPYSLAWVKEQVFGPAEPRQYTQEEQLRFAVDRLRLALSVNNPRQSFVFQIGMSAGTPQKAADLANAIAQQYIDDQLIYKEEQSQVAIAFLEERTSGLQAELGVAELAVKDFAASTELVSPEALAAKNRQVKELRDRIEALTATLENLQANFEELDELTGPTLTLETAQRIDNAGLIRLARDQVAGIELNEDRFSDAVEAARTGLERQIAQTNVQREALLGAVAGLEQEVADQSRDLLTLQQLQREADAVGEIYLYFLTRLKEAEVQQGTQQPDARLLSAAVLPRGPSSPRVAMIIALMGILGGIIGVGIALLSELRKSTIRTTDDLAKITSVAVLGQLPAAPIKHRNDLEPMLLKKDNSVFAEAIRNLRTSVLLTNPETPPQIILLSSSVPGEGKTTTAISLASSLVGLGKKVLLVEIDVRKLTLSEYFGDLDGPTLLDVLDGDAAALLKNTAQTKLGFNLLMGGRSNKNAADLFSSIEFANFVKTARDAFDYVIFDAPPILPVSDARIVGRHADAVLYACAWDDTRPELIEAGLAEFAAASITPSGMVITKIDGAKAKRYGGSTRYGGYYGSYGKGYYG